MEEEENRSWEQGQLPLSVADPDTSTTLDALDAVEGEMDAWAGDPDAWDGLLKGSEPGRGISVAGLPNDEQARRARARRAVETGEWIDGAYDDLSLDDLIAAGLPSSDVDMIRADEGPPAAAHDEDISIPLRSMDYSLGALSALSEAE